MDLYASKRHVRCHMKVSTTFDFRPLILDFDNYYVLHYVLHFSIYYVLHPSDYVLHLFIDYVLHTYSHYVLQVEYVMEYVKKKTRWKSPYSWFRESINGETEHEKFWRISFFNTKSWKIYSLNLFLGKTWSFHFASFFWKICRV